ncbi:MAG: hypothetical protein AB1791_19445, partial [Chloroflexota bacterium]
NLPGVIYIRPPAGLGYPLIRFSSAAGRIPPLPPRQSGRGRGLALNSLFNPKPYTSHYQE